MTKPNKTIKQLHFKCVSSNSFEHLYHAMQCIRVKVCCFLQLCMRLHFDLIVVMYVDLDGARVCLFGSSMAFFTNLSVVVGCCLLTAIVVVGTGMLTNWSHVVH